MKHLIANTISLLPVGLAFVALMCSFGTEHLDNIGVGILIGAALLFLPCQYAAKLLWR